jgi:hypothetical protein
MSCTWPFNVPTGVWGLNRKGKGTMNTVNAKKLYMIALTLVVLGLVIKPTSGLVLSVILLPIKVVVWFALAIISIINWFALLVVLIIGAAAYVAYCRGWIF